MQIDAAIANIVAIAAIFGFLLLERTSGVSLVIFPIATSFFFIKISFFFFQLWGLMGMKNAEDEPG